MLIYDIPKILRKYLGNHREFYAILSRPKIFPAMAMAMTIYKTECSPNARCIMHLLWLIKEGLNKFLSIFNLLFSLTDMNLSISSLFLSKY